MRWLFAGLVVLLVTVSLALLVQEDPGYVLLAYGPWRVEMSLALFGVGLLLGLVAFYYAVRALVNVWHVPERVGAWRARRRRRRARRHLTRGLIQLAEGRWQQAERSLMRDVSHSETPLLNYIAAARAAQQQGAHERRDRYLRLAHESTPGADIAVGLSQAELQIAHRQLEQALATLNHLRGLAPHHGYVLKLLMKVYRELKDWRALRDLLPELYRHKVIALDELKAIEREVFAALLEQAAAKGRLALLKASWQDIPRELRHDERLLGEYARYLMALEAHDEAEPAVRGAIRRRWSDALAELYGRIEASDPRKQLTNAEEWLKDHAHNPALLLTAGRLALRNDLWGKARLYLESSLGAGPRVETYRELGGLLERLGEHDAARESYRKGVALAAGEALEADSAPRPAAAVASPLREAAAE